MKKIAALFVQTHGVYANLPHVETWDIHRDARTYAGPHAVVAHPVCDRFGRYWRGGPSAKREFVLGDDGGCFAAALEAVRKWGGVLEHPQGSHAWRLFDLSTPPWGGGWVAAGDGIGWTCCVDQGKYGHRARKSTWLYVAHTDLPVLQWGHDRGATLLDIGFHTKEERELFYNPPKGMTKAQRQWRRQKMEQLAALGKEYAAPERMGALEMEATPIAFRDLLLSLALSVQENDATRTNTARALSVGDCQEPMDERRRRLSDRPRPRRRPVGGLPEEASPNFEFVF